MLRSVEILAPTRGLRQGDPMSHYLFFICIEGLSCLIRRAQDKGKIIRFKCIRKGSVISHLFFADNSLVFSKANDANCVTVRNVLENSDKASGQEINYAYAMGINIFRLPKGLIKEIQRLCTRIWCVSNGDIRKIHCCAWSRLCSAKSDGGLGFRNLETFNRALLASIFSKILTLSQLRLSKATILMTATSLMPLRSPLVPLGWDEYQHFVKEDVEEIMLIPIGSGCIEDTLIWHNKGNGIYIVKSGYSIGQELEKRSGASNNVSVSRWWSGF
ncbi:hypothetical protein Dsin_021039 [Dipteronia sinensis]|uniref:Reverse transcriptase domain-containing protein n=1 Tax=Dipteronia sinensis TaxID=43782 RepID=A0AAE0ABI4_9ROSI|nr:hypothetical protein Dsin_021039 [Dipteronia sinensis]